MPAPGRLGPGHAVSAHEGEFLVAGRWVLSRPQVLQFPEVAVEGGGVQHEQTRIAAGGSPEGVATPPGINEAPGAGDCGLRVEFELRLAVQDPERLDPVRVPLRGRAPPPAGTTRSCRENAPPVLATVALNSRVLQRTSNCSPPPGQLSMASWPLTTGLDHYRT